MIQRKTIQLSIVYEVVNKLQNHATADEIYEETKKSYPNIGRGTIYRNLQRLVNEGLIKKIETPEGADRYDHISTDHYHIKCEICGKVFDVNMPYIKNLEEKVIDKQGFKLISHDIMFKGICPDCQKNIN